MQTTNSKQKQGKILHFALRSSYFEEKAKERAHTAAHEFFSLMRSYAIFRIAFFCIAALECMGFLIFFPLLTQSAIFAFTLAALFLTLFSYFVLRFYFDAKKPEQFEEIKEDYVASCRMLSSTPDPQEIASALFHLVDLIEEKTESLYQTFKKHPSLALASEKFTIWMHWKDIYEIKEKLLLHAVQEYLQSVKQEPCALEPHARLATAYVALAKVYKTPDKQMAYVPREYSSPKMRQMFEKFAARAIEEFKILDHFAPGELWVHAQLASLYHEMNDLEHEGAEYEAMLKINPLESDILFRLGILYFQQGQNAKALRLYEQLKKLQDPRADDLIAFYTN